MTSSLPEFRDSNSESSQGLDLREYLRVLLKYKWGIVSLALLAGIMGMYSAYKAVPIYRSAAKLQIERDSAPFMGSGYYFPMQNWEFYNTQYEMMRSWGVAELAAQKLGILDVAESAPEQLPQQQQETGFNFRSLLPWANKTPAISRTPEEHRADIIAGVQGRIRVSPVENSELVTISIEGTDPQRTADFANAVADSYVEFLKDKRLQQVSDDQNWLSSRSDQIQNDLAADEAALQAFREQHGLLETAEGVDALQTQKLNRALAGQDQARVDKIELESLYREIQSARDGVGSLDTIPSLESRGIVRELKNSYIQARQSVTDLGLRYGPKHPRMIQAETLLTTSEADYQEELNSVADGVVSEYQRALQSEQQFNLRVGSAQGDIRELNRLRAELSRLEEKVNASRALKQQLQSAEKTSDLLEGNQQSITATVIEPARRAYGPVRPDKKKIAMAWMLAGVALGIGLAFLLDHLDNTFKGSEDVERRLALPVLGMLPQLKANKDDKLAPMSQFVQQSRSAFSEAIRTIRTGVMLSTLDDEQSVIVVTSSVPGEGKTTLAINLAHSIGQMKKTILIDADMRRPMVHKAKEIEKTDPGLSSLITGEHRLDQVIQRGTEDQLDIIHSGIVPPNPLELLASRKFQELVNQLKQTYDVVIIDSAPSLAVSDALVVSQMADAVLYVIRADATPFQAAEQGTKRLRRADAPLLGVVLNQVSSSGRSYYKYGRYYRYSRYGYYGDHYHEYYGSSDSETKKQRA